MVRVSLDIDSSDVGMVCLSIVAVYTMWALSRVFVVFAENGYVSMKTLSVAV
jgi:hypothetical protein